MPELLLKELRLQGGAKHSFPRVDTNMSVDNDILAKQQDAGTLIRTQLFNYVTLSNFIYFQHQFKSNLRDNINKIFIHNV